MGLSVYDLGFRVYGLGIRVQDLKFRVEGLGYSYSISNFGALTSQLKSVCGSEDSDAHAKPLATFQQESFFSSLLLSSLELSDKTIYKP